MANECNERMEETAVFEFFVRRLPPCRNFLIAAGLEQVLEFLEGLEFTAQELEWLETTGRFRREFLDYLRELRFTGDVDSMPEGTVFFGTKNGTPMRILLPALALFLVSLSGLLAFGHYRWRAKSADFIARLIGDGPVSPPAGLSVVEFEGLPVPVIILC